MAPGAPHHLTAAHAADLLGVTRATLYAYASRGQLRSEAVPGRPRERRYARDDVQRLLDRKAARRDPVAAAARGLHWGGPVLESGITLIHDGRLYYRGRDALALAETATLEDAAMVLWAAEDSDRTRLFAQSSALTDRQLARLRACTTDPYTLMQAALPVAARVDLASYDLRPAAVRLTGARIVKLLASIVAPRDAQAPLHRALQRTWAPGRTEVGDAIRAALVLCADHELNVSAFTARCAASAGASPYDVVSAAIATLRGYKHGGAGERVLAMLAASETPRHARAQVAARLRRGEQVPGFGHPLYPNGDPRAALLIRLAESTGHEAACRAMRNLRKAGTALLNDLPNLDFGLAAITRACGLPDQAPVLLFALGRTIGWIAHAIEEYASGHLIRPRARYTGPMP
jgi:citrate synthase